MRIASAHLLELPFGPGDGRLHDGVVRPEAGEERAPSGARLARHDRPRVEAPDDGFVAVERPLGSAIEQDGAQQRQRGEHEGDPEGGPEETAHPTTVA